jgi:hypothetical protein
VTEGGDKAVDRTADQLERAAEEAAARSAVPDAAADELRGDAAFLRKLKPSLIRARMRGEESAYASPGTPAAPSGPQLGGRGGSGSDGPNPLLIVGGALLLGILLAKLIDWRGHAHPRR